MFSELKSVSFMGLVSNSDMILPEKDLNSLEFDFLVSPTLEFEDNQCDIIAPLQDNFDQHLDKEDEEEVVQDQEQEKEKREEDEEDEDNAEDEDEDEDDDGFKTPTSLDHKIPSPILTCPPPAPRKPKSTPSTKRKSPHFTAILDLSNEIESLFPPACLADLGGKIKRVRHGNDTK